MKLATYTYNNRITCGLMTEKGIIDIPSSSTGDVKPHSVKEILIRGESCLQQVKALADTAETFIDPRDVRFLAGQRRKRRVRTELGPRSRFQGVARSRHRSATRRHCPAQRNHHRRRPQPLVKQIRARSANSMATSRWASVSFPARIASLTRASASPRACRFSC